MQGMMTLTGGRISKRGSDSRGNFKSRVETGVALVIGFLGFVGELLRIQVDVVMVK